MRLFTRVALTILIPILAACAGSGIPGQATFSTTKEPPPHTFSATKEPPHVETLERQLLVDGNAFRIKGVGYSPVPIGTDPEVSPPNGDYYTANYKEVYQRDIPLLRKMGANTIRLWGWNNSADHTDFLDEAYNQGANPIYVIVSYWIGGGQDLSDPSTRNRLISDFRNMVALNKNHPAVLMWMIGNELNAPWMYGNAEDLFTLINEMAKAAHEEEGPGYHPVTTPLADVNLLTTIELRDALMPDLDVWSVQIYRGKSFGDFFQKYQAVSHKPLLVSEYGIDAYDDVHGDEYENMGEAQQAVFAEALWKEIEACPVCIGGSIMAYSDEWWKGKYGQADKKHLLCPENDPAVHSHCGYTNANHPDGYANEEWWGIMRTVKNEGQPDLMQPRKIYDVLRSLWGNQTFLPLASR